MTLFWTATTLPSQLEQRGEGTLRASPGRRGAVFAEMDLHITNTHRRFVSEAERALGAAGAGDLSSELFLKAVGRVMLLLGVRREVCSDMPSVIACCSVSVCIARTSLGVSSESAAVAPPDGRMRYK